MTEWHSPEELPGAEPDPGGPAEESTSHAAEARSTSHQKQLIILAGVIIAAAVALALIVLLGGSDGPAKGSPEALTDDFASALHSGSSARVGELSCPATKADVLRSARDLLGSTSSASRQGSATVRGDVAVARIAVTAQGGHRVGTLALSHTTGHWCVSAFLAAVPAQ